MSTSRGTATSPTSRWRPPLAWAGVILVATSWPSSSLGNQVTGADKVAHLGLYGVLGFLVARALLLPRRRVVMVAALAWITVFAMLDEVHQHWIPGRDASIADWAADILGATLGLLAATYLFSLAPRRPDPTT